MQLPPPSLFNYIKDFYPKFDDYEEFKKNVELLIQCGLLKKTEETLELRFPHLPPLGTENNGGFVDKLRTEFQFLSIPLFKAKNTDVEFRIGNSFFLNWLLQKHTNKGKKGCLNVNKQAIKGSQFVNKDGLRAYIQVSGRYTFFPFFLFFPPWG